jgi:hypothetical protein
MIEYDNCEEDEDFLEYQYGTLHWKPLGRERCRFPEPKNIDINMMPFIVEPGYPTIPKVPMAGIIIHRATVR